MSRLRNAIVWFIAAPIILVGRAIDEALTEWHEEGL